MAERLCVTAGPQARDFLECLPWPGRDHRDVVVEKRPVAEFELIAIRMQAPRARGGKTDPLSAQRPREIEPEGIGRSDPGRHGPGMKIRLVRDDGDLLTLARNLGQPLCREEARCAAAKDDRMRHRLRL